MSSFKLAQRAMDRLVQSNVADVAKDAQKQLDAVYHQHEGATVSVVEPAAARAFLDLDAAR